jgi:hypothetical protein
VTVCRFKRSKSRKIPQTIHKLLFQEPNMRRLIWVFEPVGPEYLVLIVTKSDIWESSPDSILLWGEQCVSILAMLHECRVVQV